MRHSVLGKPKYKENECGKYHHFDTYRLFEEGYVL